MNELNTEELTKADGTQGREQKLNCDRKALKFAKWTHKG